MRDSLTLDRIDAVDLVVRLQELTSRKLNPEAFKSVRTVWRTWWTACHALLAT